MKHTPGRNPVLRLARTASLTLACGYLGLAGLLYSRQEVMVFPGARTQGTSSAQFAVPDGAQLVRLPVRGGDEVAVLWGPSTAAARPGGSEGKRRPTLLLFYGNGMCLADSLTLFRQLRQLGADVLVAEYLGYGQSDGKPSEAGFYTTADAAYDFLVREKRVVPQRLIAVGRSLGGAVALDLASRREVGGVVTLSTFTSIADVAAPRFPHFPVRALLRHRFESLEKVRRIRCPLLLIHGSDDEVIPFRMRDALAAAAGGAVTRYDVSGAGHNNLFDRDGDGVHRAISTFIARCSRPVSH